MIQLPYVEQVFREERTCEIRSLRCPGLRCRRLVYVVRDQLAEHDYYHLAERCELSSAEVLDRAKPRGRKPA